MRASIDVSSTSAVDWKPSIISSPRQLLSPYLPPILPCSHHMLNLLPTLKPQPTQASLIKSNLCRRLCDIPRILVERPISLMPLLLDRRPKLQQLIRHRLSRGFEHVDQGPGLRFIVFSKQCNRQACCACTASPVSAIPVSKDSKTRKRKGEECE